MSYFQQFPSPITGKIISGSLRSLLKIVIIPFSIVGWLGKKVTMRFCSSSGSKEKNVGVIPKL